MSRFPSFRGGCIRKSDHDAGGKLPGVQATTLIFFFEEGNYE